MSRPVKRLLSLLVVLALSVDARPPNIKRGTYRYDPDSIPQNEQILRLFLHLAAHTANRLIFLKNDERSKLPNKTHESVANSRRIPLSNETDVFTERRNFVADQTIPNEPSVRLFDETANVKKENESTAGNVYEEKGFTSNQTSGLENTESTNIEETLNVTNASNPENGGEQGFASDQTNLDESGSLQTVTTEETRNVNNSNDPESQINEKNANYAHNETAVKNPISSPVGVEENSNVTGMESEPKNEVVEDKNSLVNDQVNIKQDDSPKEEPSNPQNNQDYQKNIQENVNYGSTLPKETSINAIQFGMSVTSTRNNEAQVPVLQRKKGLFEGTGDLLSIPRELGKAVDSVGQSHNIIGSISSGLKTLLPLGKENAKEMKNSEASEVNQEQMEIASRLLFVDDKSGSQNGGIPRIADSVTEVKQMNSATLVPVEPIVQQIPGSNILGNNTTEIGSVLSKVPPPTVVSGLLDNSETENRPEVRLFKNKVSEAVETILSPVTTNLDEGTAKIVKDSIPINKIESVVPLFRAFPEMNSQSNPKVTDSEASTSPKGDTENTKMDEGIGETPNISIKVLDSFVQKGLKSNNSGFDQKILPSKINSNSPGTIENIGKLVPAVNEPKSMIPMFRAFPDFEISQENRSTLPERFEEKQIPDNLVTPPKKYNNHVTLANYSETGLLQNNSGDLKKCDDRNNVAHYSNRPTAIQDQFHAENSAIELKESLPFSGQVHLDDDLNGSISESALKDISDRLFTVLQSANEEQVKYDLEPSTVISPSNKVEAFNR